MSLTNKLTQLHNEKESLELQANYILNKYGSLNGKSPELHKKEITTAFFRMLDLGLNFFPKENADKEALEDYNKWYSLQQDIASVIVKSKIIGMRLKGFSDKEIIKVFNYKTETNLDDILSESNEVKTNESS